MAGPGAGRGRAAGADRADRRQGQAPGDVERVHPSILAAGTRHRPDTADPRLLLARESYLTGLPEDAARAWERKWAGSPRFRRTLRVMTAASGAAFLLDAAARVVMAYTLPVDLVPFLSTALLVVLLVVIVQASKAYGRRHLRRRAWLIGKWLLAYNAAMTDVYKALADPTRRAILDELSDRDGQTLFELCSRLAVKHGLGSTRQAISQHLDVLESAGLVRTRKESRYKFHHLDTTPLETILQRWRPTHGKEHR